MVSKEPESNFLRCEDSGNMKSIFWSKLLIREFMKEEKGKKLVCSFELQINFRSYKNGNYFENFELMDRKQAIMPQANDVILACYMLNKGDYTACARLHNGTQGS